VGPGLSGAVQEDREALRKATLEYVYSAPRDNLHVTATQLARVPSAGFHITPR
jgi:hypothetical protein